MSRFIKRSASIIVFVLLSSLQAAVYAANNNDVSTNLEQVQQLAEEAYIYGLGPMVYYRLYSEQLVKDTKTIEVNVLLHRRKLSDHAERGGQAPNHDTLYSVTWLNVGTEPLVVQIPDYEERFYGIQLTSMYQDNFQNIGNSMAYGNREAYKKEYTFLLATQDWQGKVPDGLDVVRAPGPIIHFLQRTYVTPNNPEDLKKANKLQDMHLIVPLSNWNKGSRKPVVLKPTLPDFVEKTDLDYFSGLDQLLTLYPPDNTEEKTYIERFKAINIGAARQFNVSMLTPEERDAFLVGMTRGKQKVADLQARGIGYETNGWTFTDDRQGNYKDDYLLRAASVSLGGIVPRPQFNSYTLSFKDANGELLSGDGNYHIHFKKEDIPQVTAFWSLTVYGSDFWLPDLSDKRYKLSNLSPGIIFNEDGSLDMYLQYEQPSADKLANWLPIPKAGFFAVIRFYAPKKDVIEGEYSPPSIDKVSD